MPRVVPPNDGGSSSNTLSPSIVETVAGFTAGVVATLAVHPFDVLKTRLQRRSSSYISRTLLTLDPVDYAKSQWGHSFKVLRRIVRDEGSYAALYRGLMPNMIGNSVSWALYFLWYVMLPS